MRNKFEEHLSVINKGYHEFPKDFIESVKSMRLYEAIMKFYEKLKPLNIKKLDLKIQKFVPLIEKFKKYSVGDLDAEYIEWLKDIPASEFEKALFMFEFNLFVDVVEITGDFQMDLISNGIIASKDVEELTELYRILMQMDRVNENLIIEPFDNSKIQKRKSDIPILQDSIIREVEYNLKKKKVPTPQVENIHPKIFENGVFEIFEKWIEISTDNSYYKLSFIFQKLKQDEQLRTTAFKPLLSWCSENEIFTDEDYGDILIRNNFVSPTKVLTKGREKEYQTMLDNHFPNFSKNTP